MDRMSTALAADEAQRRAIATGMENGTEFLSTVANDPTGFAAAVPQIALGTLTAPGKLAYHAAADVVSRVAGQPEYGGNLRADQTGATPPVDQFLAAVSQTNPKSAVAGKVGKSLAEMSGLGAVGLLPSGLAKLAAAGFTVDMVAHAPQQFRDYAEEIAKPAAEQSPDKITSLQSDIIQTFTFAPLAGAHAAKGAPGLGELKYALDLARGNTPQRSAHPDTSMRPALPAEEGAPVPTWDATEAISRQPGDSSPDLKAVSRELTATEEVKPNEAIEPQAQGQERLLSAPPESPASAVPEAATAAGNTENVPAVTQDATPPTEANLPPPEQSSVAPPKFEDTRPAEQPAAPAQQETTRKGQVGGMLSSGEVVLTSSGRRTTPFPKVTFGSERKASNTLRNVDVWLRDNALAEARARGDEFNARMFKAEKGKTIPQASKDAMEEYLFGQQPDVVKPLLKTVKPAEPAKETGVVDTIAGSMNLSEFEQKGYAPEQVTRQNWIDLQRAERRRLGQSEESGTRNAPFADYEEFHKQAVKDALANGETVDPEVLKDYPDLSKPAKAAGPPPASPAPSEPALPKSQGHVAFVQHDQFTGMPVAPVEFYIKGRTLYRADTTQPIRAGVRKSGYSVELKNGKIKETGQTVAEYIKTWTDYMNKSAAQSREQMTGFAKAAEARAAEARKPIEPSAAAADKMQEHVTEVAQGQATVPKSEVRNTASEAPITGPRPAREVKAELVQRLEKIAAEIPEPQFRESKVITKGGRRTFNYSLGDVLVEVSEAARASDGWVARTSELSGKTGARTEKIVGKLTSPVDITKAKEWAGAILEKLVYPERAKPITVEIPGDGTFTIEQTHYAINRVLDRARKLNTSSGGKGYTEPERPNFNQDEWYRQARGETASKRARSGRARAGSVASPPALGGGELGKEPSRGGPAPAVADDPRHSVFDAIPMEMPEAVRMVKAFTGLYPQIRRRLGQAAGRFTFTEGENASGRVSLLASIFDLLDANDKARLKQEARNYAQAQGGSESQQSRVARERYAFLLEQAYAQAKLENPKQALKVMWHEIGHVVDWLPNHLLVGRGNFFGRIASLKGYLKHVLPLDPKRIGPFQEKPTPAELSQIRKAAFDAVQAEIGPMREIVETILVEEPIYREAGITPEMVKQLFGMDARETMPELYRWFAEQPADVKKDIVRAAMKGLVDERLTKANLAGREQIGTRTVEREVRRREGRPPTPEEVEARFKQLFRAELERRNIALLEQIKAELEPTIAWWRGTAKMESYFRTSEEMYAEAFSVFANNPAALESRAPTYAKLIWNYLDRKPEVKALYDQIQSEIKSGVVMPGRVKALWDMWDTQDRHSLEVARDAAKLRGRDVLDNVQYHLDRRFGPIYRAAKGTPAQGRIADAVGNFLYRMSEHERFLAALNLEVGQLLVKHNLDWSHDLGEFLFHNRIIHERFNLANPLGWTSKNSTERLREMEATLGPERWAALQAAGEAYRAQYEKFVVAELNAARMFAPELQDALNANAHYATFAAIKGVKDNGIEQMLANRYGSGLTPHIYRQIGNLGEIRNPATATVLKGLSLISAAYRNSMKREVVQMLRRHHPEDITPAATRWNGKAREPVLVENHPSVGTIVYLHEGKPYAWNVRRVVADAVNGGSGSENLAFSLLLNATGWQKGLFTQLNYGFWPFNFARDTLGWWMQMPGALAPVGWARHLPRALLAARQSVTHSQPNPWADAALRRKMLISKGDPRGTWAASDNEFEVKLASFGMDPAQWSGQADAVHRVVKAWDFYKNLGQTVERVNKIAGMLYLDEKFPSLPEWKKREIVRERAGSPNFLERGASNPAVDLLFLFYNPWKESVRSVAKSAREHPWSFAAKATTAIALPTVLQAAAVNGWLGKDRQEQYNSVPDFDLTNYLVVPLGWVNREQRRVAYLRLPLWETARIAHGLAFQAMTSRGTGMTAHAGGQLPGLNPMWKIGLAWAEYLQGKNPVDVTRAVNVMPDKTFAAGGPAVLAEMGKYTWNELGGSILYRFQNLNLESSPESEGEKLLAAPGINNALGRWIKVSDRGLADQQRRVANETKQARAEVQLGVDEILRRLTGPGSWENLMTGLQQNDPAAVQRAMAAAALSPAERMLLREPYALEYFTRKFPELVASKANINARMWFNSQSNDERAKLIQRGIIQPAVPAP